MCVKSNEAVFFQLALVNQPTMHRLIEWMFFYPLFDVFMTMSLARVVPLKSKLVTNTLNSHGIAASPEEFSSQFFCAF